MAAKKQANDKPNTDIVIGGTRGQPSVPQTVVLGALQELGKMGFAVARQVTLSPLTLEIGKPRALRVMEKMRPSDFKKPEDTKPATICPVTDVQTGEQFMFLVPTTVQSNLDREYPGDAYVGKIFLVTRMMQRPGKRYFDYNITEVQLTGERAQS